MPIMYLYLFLFLLGWHWVSDLVFQSHDMATKKATSNRWLLWHVTVYIALFMGPVLALTPGRPLAALWFILINFGIHLCVDYITSRINAKAWKEQRWHDLFVSVGLDGYLHQATLLITGYLFLCRRIDG